MNIQEKDIVNMIFEHEYETQRAIAEQSGHSLGIVNKSLKHLVEEGYLDENMKITQKTSDVMNNRQPKRAIILAAGYGMRMVPINTETPKGLLEINGEPLVERFIKQLKEVGILDIYIVVGFMKEQYEYLIDDYGVTLLVNSEYQTKNNMHSLKLALDYLDNSYIIPCDIWCGENPFHKHELYSWYMVGDLVDEDSDVRVNRKMELTKVDGNLGGNQMIGICYLQTEDAALVRKKINELTKIHSFDHSFWEEALFEKEKMITAAKIVHSSDVVEINTYEQLRELDCQSGQLKTEAISTIMETLQVTQDQIQEITVLKKGMTNRSFLFTCKNKKYIMRIPGEGTDQLVNREEEADVYHAIIPFHICDDVAYINPENGYKITEFLNDARVCDAKNIEDVQICMDKLRYFHSLKIKVNHQFDLFQLIEFYESLWNDNASSYKDYMRTKQNVKSLKKYIDKHATEKVLTHIDAVPDNFLILPNEEVRLIDWEYAGMQDPHVDIAMFAIYAMYDKDEIDQLIRIYFHGECEKSIRVKIYCYIATCGLLWSNWCEYKRTLGIEFGEYSLKQYRYAKDYYKIAVEQMNKGADYE